MEGRSYILTISPEGLKLVLKGKRKGHELAWEDLVSGGAALATALNASLKHTLDRPQRQQPAERQRRDGSATSERRQGAPTPPKQATRRSRARR